VNQEKVLGYFIFWPEAAEPWITFTDGMNPPEFYTDASYSGNFEDNTFSIYPGRSIKATAFQAQGVSKVEFSLHYYDAESKEITGTMPLSYLEKAGVVLDYADDAKTSLRIRAEERPNGGYSTIFPWDFIPPPRSGNYAVRARAFDFNETPSTIYYEAVFIVKDITFPDFTVPPAPAASNPLFESIENNKITISGIVSDATEIESLYFVWINPQSRSYAAMSQLSYFRDANYKGWRDAVLSDLADGESMEDNTFDPLHRNRVWKVAVEYIGEDNGTKWNARDSWAENGKLDKWDIWEGDIEPTYRQLFYYELEIDITEDLNIAGVGPAAAALGKNQPLTSQVFLFRAGNPDGKCTIITYTPQGDTLSPSIAIQEVRVLRDGSPDVVCLPREFIQVPQFKAGDRIRVSGTWREDSTEYLPIQTYLTPNMEFEINGVKVPGTLTPETGLAASGTFLIDIIVTESGGELNLPNMKDTLVVNATVKDVGGNPAETGSSWLIESDTLRFLRISSLNEDKAYKAGDKIEIFLEFNKPVTLKNPGSNPVLTLNTTGSTGTASYRTEPPQTNESTRHYFTYTVGSSENTPVDKNLNVNGLSGGAAWQEDAYPFTWVHNGLQGSKEEIRITMTSGHNGVLLPDGFYARALPVTDDPDDNDYPFTLIGGKRITVDNQTPTITSFSASPQGWHGVGTDIYITASFSEPVKLGTVTPYLILNTGGSSPGDRTSTDAADIRVNNNQITFRYTVKAGDNTGTSQLQATGFGGDILDIPGTGMTASPTGTLTGVYLDTAAPPTPVVAVFSGISPSGTEITGTIPATLYHDDVFIRITGTGTTEDYINLGRIEYTLNGGQNWISSTSTPIDVELVNKGPYTIRTRQTDQAGNISSESGNTTFNWDPGPLITRISSEKPNGLYTHNAAFGNGNSIPITVYFRKPLIITASGGIWLNATDGGGAPIIVAAPSPIPGGSVTSLSFTYNVQNGHSTPVTTPPTYLNVDSIISITATDINGVPVDDSFFTMPASGSSLLLNENKEIRVETGNLTRSTDVNPSIYFQGDTSNETIQGIQADGSYWTTLHIVFNHAIFKGSGTITIEQKDAVGAGTGGGYRIPAVITESQYNRFRGVAAAGDSNDNFNKYYTRGTNGYIYDSGTPANSRSDTSAKYVLNYRYNPNSAFVTANPNTGDTPITPGFFTAFKAAEAISINVTALAVETSGNILKVRLTGSNAPQVPGATYVVRYDAGLVSDSLGNSSPAQTLTAGEDVTLDGVARPFVRIKKTQDTIEARAGANNTTPTLTATQPLYAYARMDCRTPNSVIYYRAQGTADNVTGVNWSNTGNPPTASAATYPANTLPEQQYSQPTTGNGIQIGSATFEGYKWWVRAQAMANNIISDESHEMAYRTAITYRLMGAATNDTTSTDMVNPASGGSDLTTGQQRIFEGDQIWIRGGDSIGSSSIPGFPFTWKDDFDDLRASAKRAGIRLMTKVNNSTHQTGGNQNQLWNSQWQFLTWDINATAYVDFILGRDRDYLNNANDADNRQFYESGSINEVWQYGPRYWALQRAGWTGLKTQYPVFPGEHRWVNTGTNLPSTANPINYSNAFNSRPSNGRITNTTYGNTLPVSIDPANVE